MSVEALMSPTRMGALDLPNRVMMAPLTRNRAHGDGTPWEKSATYYAQRAGAGLIISEATQISAMGKGYLDTPGIHAPAHVAGWRQITDAVHAEGGRIVAQLWHVGRISHVSLLPEGRAPVSASAVRAKAQTFTANGFEDTSQPVALTLEDIESLKQDYRHAAAAAREAGFDGVEVHSANGYLLDQFLQDGSNHRDDDYGGSIRNRLRLLDEVLDVVAGVWGRDRVGVRLSPLGQANDMGDSDPEALFAEAYRMIAAHELAYLHVVESFPGSEDDPEGRALLQRLRAGYDGFYIANGGYDAQSAEAAIAGGHADAVSFGRAYIANPDLAERFATGAALNAPDPDTFYGGGEEGYLDYPFRDKAA